jgi:hypothetical protein
LSVFSQSFLFHFLVALSSVRNVFPYLAESFYFWLTHCSFPAYWRNNLLL